MTREQQIYADIAADYQPLRGPTQTRSIRPREKVPMIVWCMVAAIILILWL